MEREIEAHGEREREIEAHGERARGRDTQRKRDTEREFNIIIKRFSLDSRVLVFRHND